MSETIKTPLFNFAKKQNLYHFDHDAPDDNDIIFKPKFTGEWQHELEHFVTEQKAFVDMENEYTKMQVQEWLNLGYDFHKFNGKMVPNENTPMIKKMAEMVPFENEKKQIFITEQKSCHYIPYHLDILASSGLDAKKVIKNGYRMLIFLTDWWPGEFMIWGNTNITGWKAGWILAWPALKYPHGTANISHHTGYRVRISALAGDTFHDWIKDPAIIEIK